MKTLWGHPHVTPSLIQSRFALQLSSLCPILHHTSQQRSLSLSLSRPSLAINSSLRSQHQTKRSFPSQHLNKHIYATSHAYQTCQLTNGKTVEQREFCIKDHGFTLRFIQHRKPAEDTSTRVIRVNIKKDWTASSNIKKGQSVPNTSRRTASSVLEGVICQRQQKGVGLSVPVQEGVTSSDMTPNECTRAAGPSIDVYSPRPGRVTTTHPMNGLLGISPTTGTADRAVLPTAQAHCAHTFELSSEGVDISETKRNYPNISLRNYYATHCKTN